MKPIIILGFGRSGTTWLADIFSRIYGGMILFEPLHPSVTERSRELSYRRDISGSDNEWLERHLRSVLDKDCRKPWLLRNHLPDRIDSVDLDRMNQIWRECPVLGFKEIRMNLMIPWLAERQIGQVIFITRSILDVTASVISRSNFWEFGWPETYDLAMTRLLAATGDPPPVARNDIERIATWVELTHEIVLADCEKHNVPVLSYEELRNEPFKTMRDLMERCGLPPRSIHPSHVFCPSLTTARTFQGLYGASMQRSA